MSKLSNIVKGFTGPTPDGKSWYEERKKICAGCEYNSANKEESEIKATQRLIRDTICSSQPVCTACSCCVDKKIKVEESICGLDEIGLEPKWKPVVSNNPVDNKLQVTCDSPGDASLSIEGGSILVESTYTELKHSFTVNFKRKGGLKLISADGSCSCTSSGSKEVSNDSFNLFVDISTKGFKGEYSVRSMTVHYRVSENKHRKVKLQFKLKNGIRD